MTESGEKRHSLAKYKKQKAYVQGIKNSICVIVLISILFFQFQLLFSLDKISISYDFSNYSSADRHPSGLDDNLGLMMSYMRNNSISVVEATNMAIENETLINEIESELNEAIDDPQLIHDAYLQREIKNNTMEKYLREVWSIVFNLLIPGEYFRPVYLNMTNEALTPITDISVDGTIRIARYHAPFLHNVGDILSYEQDLKLNFTLAGLIHALGQVAFDYFVEITLKFLHERGQITESLFEYIKRVAIENGFDLSIIVRGNIALAPLNLNTTIDLVPLLEKIT